MSSGGASNGGTTGSDAGVGGVDVDSGSTEGVSVAWAEPTASAVLHGTVHFRLTGHGFLNVEIQRDGTTIATCTVSGDHTSAVADIDTTTLPNGTLTLTAHAWDSPSGQPFTFQDDAGSLAVTIDNPAPQPTAFGEFTGVCAYLQEDFAGLQALGIKNARMDHPAAEVIEDARAHGIEVLPLATYGFTDLSGQSDDHYPPLPQNRAEWAKRMVDLWRGMQNPPRVIEVWNEPWLDNFWKPAPDPAAYLELVKAFAKEAWAVWPNVTLLVSADEGQDLTSQFRKKLLEADTSGFLNDPRIHPTTHDYVEGRTPTQVTGQPCSWDLDRFDCAYSDFKAHGHPDPKVWVTEFGWESNTPGGTNAVTPVTEQQHADYIAQALKIFRDSGHVAKAFSFLYKKNDPWNYNWLRPDNSQKPVCDRIKTLIATGQ